MLTATWHYHNLASAKFCRLATEVHVCKQPAQLLHEMEIVTTNTKSTAHINYYYYVQFRFWQSTAGLCSSHKNTRLPSVVYRVVSNSSVNANSSKIHCQC